jgi:nitronate monooxygenase
MAPMFLVSNTKMVIEGMKSCGGLHSSLKLPTLEELRASIIELRQLKCQEVVLVII